MCCLCSIVAPSAVVGHLEPLHQHYAGSRTSLRWHVDATTLPRVRTQYADEDVQASARCRLTFDKPEQGSSWSVLVVVGVADYPPTSLKQSRRHSIYWLFRYNRHLSAMLKAVRARNGWLWSIAYNSTDKQADCAPIDLSALSRGNEGITCYMSRQTRVL